MKETRVSENIRLNSWCFTLECWWQEVFYGFTFVDTRGSGSVQELSMNWEVVLSSKSLTDFSSERQRVSTEWPKFKSWLFESCIGSSQTWRDWSRSGGECLTESAVRSCAGWGARLSAVPRKEHDLVSQNRPEAVVLDGVFCMSKICALVSSGICFLAGNRLGRQRIRDCSLLPSSGNSLIILRGPFFPFIIIIESFQIALVSFAFVCLYLKHI